MYRLHTAICIVQWRKTCFILLVFVSLLL